MMNKSNTTRMSSLLLILAMSCLALPVMGGTEPSGSTNPPYTSETSKQPAKPDPVKDLQKQVDDLTKQVGDLKAQLQQLDDSHKAIETELANDRNEAMNKAAVFKASLGLAQKQLDAAKAAQTPSK